jgi:hypothetical protein
MQTTPVSIQDTAGRAIQGSRALIWGNNAAWLCVECDKLLGNRTGDTEYLVDCSCGAHYEILRAPNRSGNLDQGQATGVRRR